MLNNENYGYLVHPLSQFMDDNLKPLTSAYLKVFYAGTSASAYTYSDWEGTLNTSNIMLSMNGSANVIAEKNKSYKVMLCDALHPPSNPIWVKDNLYVISSEIISSVQIKDNAYDSVTDPIHPDNITDINELIFFRNQDSGANYPILSSEERQYGILLPAPQLEADQGKVPMYKVGDQIAWEHLQTGVTTTVSEITENTTVTLVAGQNRYLTCTNTPAISIEIADNNAYHIQINGSCTLALTGVEWWGDAITAVAAKAEISVMNNVAIGVLIDV